MTQVTIYISNIHSQRFVSGDSGEGLDKIGSPEDEDEDEKLLKQPSLWKGQKRKVKRRKTTMKKMQKRMEKREGADDE